ncbi:MAG: hypothetical protein ACXWUK_10320 [Burkholderiales bacterium]
MTAAQGAVVPHPDASRSVRAAARTAKSPARGQALIALVFMLAVATMLLVYGSTTEVSRAVGADQRTRAVLEEARNALIGRAVADANRPGSLPCPDSDDDGSADLFSGTSCPTYVGRLPWRSLGIGDLRDESGERLWYALSPNFRDHPAAPAINSDSRGTLTVFGGSEATPLATDAVAVVFAPGTVLPGQRRDPAPRPCGTSVRDLPGNRCAANYLDTTGNFSNAGSGGPFVVTAPGSQFNDKLLVILTADFMPLVERRVALETRNALLAYREKSACACFPWADANGDGASDSGVSRGRVPTVAALPQSWPAGVLPSYFIQNDWARVIRYAVGRSALEGGGDRCDTCTESSLSIDSARGYDVVLMTAGHATGNHQRTVLSDYFDDTENQNNDDRFVTPTSSSAARDGIYAIAGLAIGCSMNARVLAESAPCAEPGGLVRAVCQSATANAGSCSCASAAQAMVRPPCASAPGSTECATALAQLRTCTS